MFNFCKHKWVVKHESLTPSFIERTKPKSLGSFSDSMTEGTRLVIMACTECGKVDKTIVKV